MNTKAIVKEYNICKNRIEILTPELIELRKTPDFIKVTKYGHESAGGSGIEDVHLKLLDKRRDLEIQVEQDSRFISKIDRTLGIMRKEFTKVDYETFYLKHFKQHKLHQLALKYGYADSSGVSKRLRPLEKWFELMMDKNWTISGQKLDNFRTKTGQN